MAKQLSSLITSLLFHVLLHCLTVLGSDPPNRPNIILIIADDLGWNDVGFHGSDQIPTPNIDALAYSGLILNNYYVTPICTPSRSALLTGKYPIHTGMQHGVLYGAEPRGLPLSEKLLPQYLKELNYANHIVGKWHLGSYKMKYTPLFRGFDSHLGFWTGHQDYNDHTAMEKGMWGLDLRRGIEPAWDLHGNYSTDLFTDEAVKIINDHNTTNPLFLYVAHAAVHSGNPYNPLPGPDDCSANFNIDDFHRRKFATIMTKLDESVGRIIHTLWLRNMIENSIIIFTTDNGGPAGGFNLNAASNWPLRGVKNTLWEGGIRGVGVLWSKQTISGVSNHMMHISDWLPTLLSAVDYTWKPDDNKRDTLDGIDLWQSFLYGDPSNRTEILHNIDDNYGNSAITVGDWKYLNGNTYGGHWDDWYGPSGRRDNKTKPYNTDLVLNSQVGKIMQGYSLIDYQMITQTRNEATITCDLDTHDKQKCNPLISPCLFNMRDDPCETENLALRFPKILTHLESIVKKMNETAVPPGNQPIDPRGNPKYWGNLWTNFGDFDETYNIIRI